MISPLAIRPALYETLSDSIKIWLTDLQAYDYAKIKKRLVKSEGFSEAGAEAACLECLRFFTLIKLYQKQVVPSKAADSFWHAFILHTEIYTDFCQYFFGYYLHHIPSDEDNQEEILRLRASQADTNSLNEQTFLQQIQRNRHSTQSLCVTLN